MNAVCNCSLRNTSVSMVKSIT